MRRCLAPFLTAVCLAVAVGVPARAEVRYAVIPLIEGSATKVPEGMGLNQKGEVVGSMHSFGDTTFWIWRNGQLETHAIGGGYRGGPSAINNPGQVVGWYETGDYYYDNWGDIVYIWRGFLWEAGQMTDLGTLGGWFSSAQWISDTGWVTGNSDDGQGGGGPFLWKDGTMRALSSLATNAQGWTFELEPHYVSADGRIWGAGTYRGTNGCIYEMTPQLGGSYSMGYRGRIDALDARVHALNEAGNAAGIGYLPDGAGGRVFQGFFWDGDTTLGLGTLGKSGSFAYGLNKRGEVVGMYDSDNYHAFVWEDGVMCDLNGLVPPDSGYTLRSGDAINDDGFILCNGGNLAARTSAAFLLVPLERIRFELRVRSGDVEGLCVEVWGTPGLPVALDCSTNLSAWVPLGTSTNLTEPRVFMDATGAEATGGRFYRARWPVP